jgi:hypothetical protein
MGEAARERNRQRVLDEPARALGARRPDGAAPEA